MSESLVFQVNELRRERLALTKQVEELREALEEINWTDGHGPCGRIAREALGKRAKPVSDGE